jgi:hypothetical protein
MANRTPPTTPELEKLRFRIFGGDPDFRGVHPTLAVAALALANFRGRPVLNAEEDFDAEGKIKAEKLPASAFSTDFATNEEAIAGTAEDKSISPATLAAVLSSLLPSAPSLLSVPTISGNSVGSPITSTPGTWTGEPDTFDYQWQQSDDGVSGWTDLTGETADTLVPGAELEGLYVRVQVVANNGSGSSAPASSAASEPIAVPEGPSLPTGMYNFWRLSDLASVNDPGSYDFIPTYPPGTVSHAAGKVGNAVYLTEGAVLDNTSLLPESTGAAFTVSFWFKATALLDGINMIFSSMDDIYQDGVLFYVDKVPEADPVLVCEARGAAVSGSGEAATTPALNTWYHVVIRRDAVGVKVYINGAEEISFAAVGALYLNNNGYTVFGCDTSYTGSFTGGIDALGIWHRALSELEIASLYNGGDGLEP